MFEHFTERSRKVMSLANQEAQKHNHEYIGAEHILLALVEDGTNVGDLVIKNLGIDLRRLYLEIEKRLVKGPGTDGIGRLPLTPGATTAIKNAVEEARKLEHGFIGTEHLLLGVLRAPEGVAAEALAEFGLKFDPVRAEMIKLLGA